MGRREEAGEGDVTFVGLTGLRQSAYECVCVYVGASCVWVYR